MAGTAPDGDGVARDRAARAVGRARRLLDSHLPAGRRRRPPRALADGPGHAAARPPPRHPRRHRARLPRASRTVLDRVHRGSSGSDLRWLVSTTASATTLLELLATSTRRTWSTAIEPDGGVAATTDAAALICTNGRARHRAAPCRADSCSTTCSRPRGGRPPADGVWECSPPRRPPVRPDGSGAARRGTCWATRPATATTCISSPRTAHRPAIPPRPQRAGAGSSQAAEIADLRPPGRPVDDVRAPREVR